ncbi:MAG: T9SS type A sorting domain-containing protein [Bacteroidetes bacterium]|nr:T9SS type A sorting domain-containing protein [Bacteroidota bacterium]
MKNNCMNLPSKFVSLFTRVTLLLLVSASTLFSQEIEWQNTIGGNWNDYLQCVHQTSDGGYILGGWSSSGIFGDKTENNIGSDDYWILKTDSAGNILWQNTIGGSSTDKLFSIQQTYDGGFILGGHSVSDISGDKTENSMGSSWDYWFVKTDSIGNIQWQNTIGGNDDDHFISIEQTSDGGYILGGSSKSNISGDKTENSLGYIDYWIVKTDSSGNIQWQNTIGGSLDDVLQSIKQTSDGGFILGGFSKSDISGDKTENAIGLLNRNDYWIVKVDSIGNIQWQNTIGGNDVDLLYSIQQTYDGGYILGGWSVSNFSGDKTENSLGYWDYWILKTDDLGNIQWQNTIGGNFFDGIRFIEQTNNGGFILGGESTSNISGYKSENCIGTNDFWIVRTDEVGQVIWENTIGGNDFDGLLSIEQTSDGSFILGGSSLSNISEDKSKNCLGNNDYWIVKLTDNLNLISGHLFADINNNGIQDSGEPPLAALKITEQITGRFTYADQNGNYKLSVLDTGNFTLSPQSINWFNPSPISHTSTFSAINQADSLNDFAFQPQGTFEDVCITITPLGNFRSGFNANYMISYGNYGTTTVSNPIVYFYPYSNVTFQSATVTPSQIFPDSVQWNIPALTPFQTGSIIVTVNVNPGLPIGTFINSSAHIEPYATDDNPSCNNSNWEVYTTGSLDPNDILVNEDTLTTTQLSNAPWLEYIIRFQNTGNDTAFTVKILNPIDTNKLNLSTFEFTNASHPVNLNWINYQRNMEFKFENILLPDSNINEPLSHGFVRYRIQPKTTLTAGDSITNFAAIYFDFNEPVITNTAKTIIILPTGIASATQTQGKLHVFPNPAENTINISGIQLENGKVQLRLMDIYGKLILEKTVTTTNSTLETNQLANGVYLIQSGGRRATFVKK